MEGKGIFLLVTGLISVLSGIYEGLPSVASAVQWPISMIFAPKHLFDLDPLGIYALSIGSILFYIGLIIALLSGMGNQNSMISGVGLILGLVCILRLLSMEGFKVIGAVTSPVQSIFPFVLLAGGLLMIYSAFGE